MQVQKRREIGVIDPNRRGGGDYGLCMQRHTHPGSVDHTEVIGPVADGQRVGDFKSGLYYLCKKRPHLEAVPVYLHNMGRVLPRDEYLPVPLLSSVTFGAPLWLESGESKTDFLARARDAVLRLAPRDDD